MAKKIMLDTKFLFQPRGPATAYLFRMATPAILIRRTNPRTRKPYGTEIRESLGGTRDLKVAREERDRLLGEIREEQKRAMSQADGSMEQALEIAQTLNAIDDPEERDDAEHTLIIAAEDLEAKITKRLTPKIGRGEAAAEGERKAVRWYSAAVGKRIPVKAAYERYKEDRGNGLSKSSLNNLATAISEFLAFAGNDACLQDVDRRVVAEFVTKFLPNRKGPKAPNGQGPATISKKVSQLSQVWRWSQKRGLLQYSKETPWDDQAPSKKEVQRAQKKRRDFTPAETRALLSTSPAGTALGDTLRVALLCGVRLEEVAALDASQVDPDGRFYVIREGKVQ